MIYELVTPDANAVFPHWNSIPWLKDKNTIRFSSGLNIIVGPNGSGKSTVLTTLACLAHCHQGSFQKITTDSTSKIPKNTTQYFVTNGSDIRHISGDQDIGYWPGTMDYDFLPDYISALQQKGRASSGQFLMGKLNRALGNKVRGPEEAIEVRCDYLKSYLEPLAPFHLAGSNARSTLLLDEAERSFDVRNTGELWDRIVKYSRAVQIIVVSHSILAFGIPEANYIETEDGFIQKTLDMWASQGWSRSNGKG